MKSVLGLFAITLALAFAATARAQTVESPLEIAGPAYSSGVIDTCSLETGHFAFDDEFSIDGPVAVFHEQPPFARPASRYEIFASAFNGFEAQAWVCKNVVNDHFIKCVDASSSALMHLTVPKEDGASFWVVLAPLQSDECGEVSLTSTYSR